MLVPPRPRVRIEDKGYELRIGVPPRRDAASIGQWLFLTGWLCGWLIGEVFAGGIVIAALVQLLGGPTIIGQTQPAPHHGPDGAALIFIGGWLLAWTAGGFFAIQHWLHLMWGRELIVVDSQKLSVVTFPLHRAREYTAPDISHMRVSVDALMRTRQWTMPQRHVGGAITFTYGGQEYGFGATLDPAEAEQVIGEIGRRFKWMVEAPPDQSGGR